MLSNRILVAQDGKTHRFYDDLVRGRVVTINMLYTRCTGICPGTLSHLLQVQDLLGDAVGRDVHMLTITLDPEHDSPEVLAAYMRTAGVGPGWTFLTGRRGAVESVRHSLGLYDPDPVADQDPSRHSGLVVLGNDPYGRWSTVPAGFAPRRIVEALRRVMDPPSKW